MESEANRKLTVLLAKKGCGSAAPSSPEASHQRHTPGVNIKANIAQQLINNLQFETECIDTTVLRVTDISEGCPAIQKNLERLRNRPTVTSWCSLQGNVKLHLLHLARIIPSMLAQKDWRDNKLAMTSQQPTLHEEEHPQHTKGGHPSFLLSSGEPSWMLQWAQERQILQQGQLKFMEVSKGLGHFLYGEAVRGRDLEKRRPWEWDLSYAYKYLVSGRIRKAELFLVVSSERTRGNRHKLNARHSI